MRLNPNNTESYTRDENNENTTENKCKYSGRTTWKHHWCCNTMNINSFCVLDFLGYALE